MDRRRARSCTQRDDLAFNTPAVALDPTASVTNIAAGEFVLVTGSSAGAAAGTLSSLAIATNTSRASVVLVAAVNMTLEESTQRVNAFTIATNDKLVVGAGGASASDSVCAVSKQEKMTCMVQDECLGGLLDFSLTLKTNFRTTAPPRCKGIVDTVRRGDDAIALSDWKQVMTASFGCPLPTKASSLTSS